MSLVGRKPRPPQLKVLNGRSPGRDSGGRKVKDPPSFVRVAPEPPSWLSREAKAEWRRVVPELARLKVLKQPSRSSLAAYCETWAAFAVAAKDARRGALITRTLTRRDGTVVEEPIANPAIAVQHAATRELRAWCAEFGLTPSSEGRLSIPDGAQADDDLD
jgi:P27 family predicted phage terminase small subunit